MKTKFTRGPWLTLPEECDKPYVRIRGTKLGVRYKVANVLTPIYDGAHEREAEETRANARLIAAAPELFEALTAALAAWDRVYSTHPLPLEFEDIEFQEMQKARAALAKATGEQA